MPDVTGIDHIYITVSDMARSQAFYTTVLGQVLGFRHNSFTLGGDPHVQFYNRHFGYVLRPARMATPHEPYAAGLHHFCLRVDTVADVTQAAQALQAAGIAATNAKLYPDYAPDYWATFFTDPDGIRLEITNYRLERRQRHDEWSKPAMACAPATPAAPVVRDVSTVVAASTVPAAPAGPVALLRLATFPTDTAPLLALIREYMAWLNVDLCGRGLDKELPQFETLFTPPSGLFVLAHVDGQLAGCAGLLMHSAHTAEVKRVFVRPAYRGLNLGERLVRDVMARAPALGARRLILDAVAPTVHAQALYRRMGFTETPPYYANPAPDTRFFEFHLPSTPETAPTCSS